MKTPGGRALGIVHTEFRGRPLWALVGEGALESMRADGITTGDLEALPLDAHRVETLVDHVMTELEAYGADLASTPGGAGWLYAQHVPTRRLVTQLVRKLLALSTWEPFAKTPGPLGLAPYEGFVGLRSNSSREYRAYTVTWSGVAYVLGAAAPYNPLRSAQLRGLPPVSLATAAPSPPPSELPQTDVVALSWSSRHAGTLRPVLGELARVGRTSLVIDLATDPADRCPVPEAEGVSLCSPPAALLNVSGNVDRLRLPDDDHVVQVEEHSVHLARLVRLVSVVLETSGGCTQPSWRSVIRTETWLDGVLSTVQPHTVLVSNDTSPLGALAVHTAGRHGINTVHVQHGAWTAESVAWPALHSRDIVVMGKRDVPLAKAWARHPHAEVHVLGQPRFDALAGLDRKAQRRYLENLLASGTRKSPTHIAVWACQPFGPARLAAQADLLLDGLWRADGDWGLVIAPHPAQSVDVFASLLRRDGKPLVALADPRVGARSLLAAADALASAYSTCGIEAALLDVPVLEIGSPGERTLGLAEHALARRCTSSADVVEALSEIPDPHHPATQTAKDGVCRWRGDSAAQVAQLILRRAGHAMRHTPVHDEAHGTDSGLPQGEGVHAR
ncbi:hypothetical protein ACK389_10790 [Streptomyces antibioticus]|uniref:hypothetical protein n=1 Tax=Streptomyces TaxID=1883 RepID=UPI00167ADD5A|nr:hypothetical protein [Streptomyces tanashiensis]GGT21941.1 hypothetical protein GCM10010222_74790 [Streptomyces tanashiensis]